MRYFRQSLGRFALSFALVLAGDIAGGVLARRYGVATNGGVVAAKVACAGALVVCAEFGIAAGAHLWDAARGRG